MKKTELKNYETYATKRNIHVEPTKTINSGALGNLFEMQVKAYFKSWRSKAVSASGKVDLTKTINGKRIKIEIKQGAGELAKLDKNGNMLTSILNSDIIIYCDSYDPSYDIESQAVWFDTETFYNLLVENGLVRYKKSSTMTKLEKSLQYHDRLTIQSLNSKRRAESMALIMTLGKALSELQ